MKVSKFLSIFLFCEMHYCTVVPFCESRNCTRHLADAFKDIAKSIPNQGWEISVVNFGADVAIIDSLIPKNSHDTNLALKVTKVKKILGNEEILKLDKSAITIFDSVKTLSKYNNKVEFTNEGPKEFQFFVHIPKATITEITAAINEIHIYKKVNIQNGVDSIKDRTEIIHFQYFLVDEIKFIKLHTFEWFKDNKNCGKRHQLTEVNRFNKKTNKWEKSSFKIEKFVDFHGCTLTIYAYLSRGEFFVYKKEWKGFLSDVYNEMAKLFNFKTSIISPHQGYDRNRFRRIQIIATNNCLPPSFTESSARPKRHLTQPYFSATEVMAVPPGEEYSSYEKLVFPFDYHTWCLIFFTFVAAYLVIFILNFTSVRIRNLVYGEQIESPSLNVAAHFFGHGQEVLPRRSFPRFLVMSFIIYSLIIRTAWQGKTFEFMNREMRKPQIDSLEVAIDKNYELYMWFCTRSKKIKTNWCHKTCGIEDER
jgi:hypothetical protein